MPCGGVDLAVLTAVVLPTRVCGHGAMCRDAWIMGHRCGWWGLALVDVSMGLLPPRVMQASLQVLCESEQLGSGPHIQPPYGWACARVSRVILAPETDRERLS